MGKGGGVVTGRPSDYRWGAADPQQLPPLHAVAQWWDGTGVLLDSEQLAHPQQRWREARGRGETGAERAGSRGQPLGQGGGAGTASRVTSLRVLPRLLTCIASFNLPSPGDLGTLSTLCSEGTGPRAGKEQVRKSPGLHSRKRRVGKARPSHLDPTFRPGGAPGACPYCRPTGLQTESGCLENRAERADPC